MSMFDLFKAPAQPVAAQPQAPVTPPPTDNAGGNGNGQNPNGINTPVNPMDAYANMFASKADDGSNAPPSLSLSDEALGKVLPSLNFSQDVPQELMDKALTGDAKSLIEIMTHVSRNAYKTSMQHNAAVTNQFVSSRSDYDLKNGVSNQVRSGLTAQELSTIPNYSHPVVRVEVDRVANAFQAQHPDASPQQVAQATSKYFADLTAGMQPVDTNAAKPKGTTDWGNYFAPKQDD